MLDYFPDAIAIMRQRSALGRRTDVGVLLSMLICRKQIGGQAIVSTTPPSTRKAAPVVADA